MALLMRKSRSLVGLTALVTALTVFASAEGQAAAARPKLSAEGEKRRPKAEKVQPVPGRSARAKKIELPGERGAPLTAAKPKVTWPSGAEGTADLRSSTPWVRAGSLPVWLTRPAAPKGARAASATAPGKVKVRVLDRAATKAAKVDGIALTVTGDPAVASPQGRVTVGLNYTSFRGAHGGDWASRLRLVKLPACALTTPSKPECRRGTPLPTRNDTKAGTLTAEVDVPATTTTPAQGGAATASSTAMVLAATAALSGPGGDWSATKLSPTSTWSAGGNTGDFSWSYPVRVPPVPGELLPEVKIGYASSAVDGKTAADNSQASWVGDGFDLWSGFVERKYKSCVDDGQQSGDQCWGTSNATMSLNGRATELVYDSDSGTWHGKSDDGSKIERLTGADNGDNDGEHWKVTTQDGTQYFFGVNHPGDWSDGKDATDSTWVVPVYGDDSGEPCHDSSFTDAWCRQAWRWNLDHVIDPHGNTITYFYGKETNYYSRAQQTSGGTWYHAGGYLKSIDYGQRKDHIYDTPAPARVVFDTDTRTDFPDDQVCDDGEDCGFEHVSPTFFDRKRLTKITTELRTGSTYDPVDSWTLGHTSQGTGILWLETIKQTGHIGGTDIAAPTVTLRGQLMHNRVVSSTGGTGVDALPPYERPRLVGVDNGTGGTVSVTYSDVDCDVDAGFPAPKSNTRRCYPVLWSPPGYSQPVNDWFHKYVVLSVAESDATGGALDKKASYDYVGGGAWRYAEDDGLTKDKYRTWSQWRGYATVRTTTGWGAGEQRSRTEQTFLRGMSGDYQGDENPKRSVTVTDSKDLLGGIDDTDPLAGTGIETRTFNGSFDDAAEVSASVSRPWLRKTATRNASWGDVDAYMAKVNWTKGRTYKSDGTARYTETIYDYDSLGRQVATDDEGDPATSADDTCTRVVYPSDTSPAGWMAGYPIRELKVAVDCDNTASSEPNLVKADMISDVKTIYDGQAYGDVATKGDVTRIETQTDVVGGASVVAPAVTNAYDAYGRTTATTQVGSPATTADDRTTTTSYTHAPEGWLQSSSMTTPQVNVGGTPTGFTTTTTYEPGRGTPKVVTDANGRTTEAEYDAMGRLVKAWLPNHPKSAYLDSPSTIYTYSFPSDGKPVSVTTQTMRDFSVSTGPVYNTSIEMYDGQLRPRQTQSQTVGGERLVTDTFYDSRGLAFKTNAPYPASGAPTDSLFLAADSTIPSQTVTQYDGAARATASIQYVKATEKWRTSTVYNGDRTTVVPPSGAMPQTTVTDARGRAIEVRQHKSATLPTPEDPATYSATTYFFDNAGRQHELKDAAGNTWSTTYDVQGRVASTSDPDKGASTLTYDAFDQVATATDARGKVLTFSYDALGRKMQVKNGANVLTAYTYDTLAKGLPTSSTRYVGANAYVSEVRGYTSMYQPTGSKITIPAAEGNLAGTYTTVQTYNIDGTPRLTEYPAAGGLPTEQVTTYYNNVGMPTWNTGMSTYVADTTYTAYGEVAQLSMASVSDKFTWQTFEREDGTRRLTRSMVDRQTVAAADTDITYKYTNAGSLTSIANASAGKPMDRQCFKYDFAQRLTEAWSTTASACQTTPTKSIVGGPAPYWSSYAYDDKTSNRTTETLHEYGSSTNPDTVRTYTYPAPLGTSGKNSPHALDKVTQTGAAGSRLDDFAYDASGNTTQRKIGSTTFDLTWDVEGHLTQVKQGGTAVADFVYDAAGNRLLRKEATTVTLYLPGQEIKLTKSSGATAGIRYYTHAGSTVAMRTSSGVQFMLADYHGTAEVTVNGSTQALIQRWYQPFGATRGSAVTWPNDKGFVGGTKDSSTGLYHLGAREYDQTTGRFISVDPLFNASLPTSWNGYGYAESNPINHSDPTGLCSEWAGCATNPSLACAPSCPDRPSSTPAPPAGVPDLPAVPPCNWWCKAKGFVKDHSTTIAATASAGIVGGACGLAVGWTGVGMVGCAGLAGAAYGWVDHTMSTPTDQLNAKDALVAMAGPAATGMATEMGLGLIARAAGRALQVVEKKIANAFPKSPPKTPGVRAAPDPGQAVNALRASGTVGARRNIAGAGVSIDGQEPLVLTAVSGQAERLGMVPNVGSDGNAQRFVPSVWPRDGRNSRFYDTEFKIFNYIANLLGPSSKSVAGKIHLHTETPVCGSCSSVIQQFRSEFPNIELRVTDG